MVMIASRTILEMKILQMMKPKKIVLMEQTKRKQTHVLMRFAAMITVSGNRSTTENATRLARMTTSVATMVMIAW